MTGPRRTFLRTALAALLVGGLAPGCVGPRLPAGPVAPPAGYQGVLDAARHGFHAVYEGELRIWFHSFRAIWYVAVSPGSDRLAVAVLSPTGVSLMQMHGDSAGRECEILLPPAARLHPYGEALWDGLWWSLAVGDPVPESEWERRRDRTSGRAAIGPVEALYLAQAGGETLERIELRKNGRRWCAIRLDDVREDAGRTYPALIRVECAQPRSRLTLVLKSIAWTFAAEGAPHAAGP